MTTGSTKVTRKGQITIPATIRDELEIREGDQIIVATEGRKIILESARAVIDRASGSLAAYAKSHSANDEEWDQAIAEAIAEDYASSLEES